MTTQQEVKQFISEMECCIMKNDWQGTKKLVNELQLLMHTNANKHRLIMAEMEEKIIKDIELSIGSVGKKIKEKNV